MYRKIALILILGGVLACGGSDGGDNTPVISDLTVSQTEFDHNEGGGAATVTITFKFADLDGDIETIYAHSSDSDETISGDANAGSEESGTLHVSIPVDTSVVGTFTGSVYLKDSKGNESNHLKADITVNP